LGPAARGGAVHRRLARPEAPRDGLHGAEAAARRHRGQAPAQTLSGDATERTRQPSQDSPAMRSATLNPTSADTAEVIVLRGQVAELKRQLEWFKRQLFGSKSERFAPAPNPLQMHLGQLLGEELPVPPPPAAGQRVPAHTRRK